MNRNCSFVVSASAVCVLAAGAAAEVVPGGSPVYQVRGSAALELADGAPGIGVFLAADPAARSMTADFEGAIRLARDASGGYALDEAKLGRAPISIVLTSDEAARTLEQIQFGFWSNGGDALNLSSDGGLRVFLSPPELMTSRMDPRGVMEITAGLTLAPDAAEALGVPHAAGVLIGQIRFTAEDRFDVSGESLHELRGDDAPSPSEGGGERICATPTSGPDVIVGDLSDTSNYGVVGGIRAYSIGTTSCNLGNVNVQWQSSVNMHPVIAQHLYRVKNGRFQQIGISHLKHGFTALAGTLCCPCSGGSGSVLGTGCSDPYGSGLNGSQGNLGPRWEVNTTSGYYPYPWTSPAAAATIGRRLQVLENDVNPALNPGAVYFIEGHYVAPDESVFGGMMNDNNNASYRRVTIGASPFNLTMSGSTVRQLPAMYGWQSVDAGVGITLVDSAPGGAHDGRFVVGYKTTDLGGGNWHYEIAVHNLNSGRLGKSFTVPLPEGAVVTNAGFYDIFHHSGDGQGDVTQDGTDWAITISPSEISWSTVDCSVNANANALHWGTMYNFWFDCNKPPAKLAATIGLFRGAGPYTPHPSGTPCGTGAPGTASAAINIPAADCNGNNVADSADIASGFSLDVNMNGVPDECELPPACPGDADGDGEVGLSDMSVVILNWFTVGMPGTLGDLDADGDRDLEDVALVINNWGNTCP